MICDTLWVSDKLKPLNRMNVYGCQWMVWQSNYATNDPRDQLALNRHHISWVMFMVICIRERTKERSLFESPFMKSSVKHKTEYNRNVTFHIPFDSVVCVCSFVRR